MADSDAKVAKERLQVMRNVASILLVCMPDSGVQGENYLTNFEKTHDDFVADLVAVVRKHVPGIEVNLRDHELTPRFRTTVSCSWKGRANVEKSKRRNAKTTAGGARSTS